MSSKEHVLAGDLLQRHRDPSGDLRFIRRHDLDFLLRGLRVSVASIRAKRSQFPAEIQRTESWQAGEDPPPAPIVRSEANVPRAGRHGRGPARSPMPLPLGENVQNEANPSRAQQRASTLWTKSYDTLDTQRASSKQSQFPRGQPCARAAKTASATGEPSMRNKANSRPDSNGQAPATPPAPPMGPTVSNEANSRTNGSGPGPAMPPAPLVRPSVRNEANLPTPAGKGAGQQSFDQTKPISGVRPKRHAWNMSLRREVASRRVGGRN